MACQGAADKRGWIKKAAMEPEKKTTKEEGQQKEKDEMRLEPGNLTLLI